MGAKLDLLNSPGQKIFIFCSDSPEVSSLDSENTDNLFQVTSACYQCTECNLGKY